MAGFTSRITSLSSSRFGGSTLFTPLAMNGCSSPCFRDVRWWKSAASLWISWSQLEQATELHSMQYCRWSVPAHNWHFVEHSMLRITWFCSLWISDEQESHTRAWQSRQLRRAVRCWEGQNEQESGMDLGVSSSTGTNGDAYMRTWFILND